MKREVRLEAVYPHPPERVWQALTDRNALAQWLLPNDFEPRLGHRFRLRDRKRRDKTVSCEVIELDAPNRLAYTWRTEADEPPTLVSWTLEPVEDGTRVRIEHIGMEEVRASATPTNACPMWESALSRLRTLLTGQTIPMGRSYLVRNASGSTAGSELIRK